MSKTIQNTSNVKELISILGGFEKCPKEINEKLKEIAEVVNLYSSDNYFKFNEIEKKALLVKFEKMMKELEELKIIYKDYLK